MNNEGRADVGSEEQADIAMKDTNYIRDDGTRVPVARLTDAEIDDLLASDLDICLSDGSADELYWVRERLLLEKTIRALGMSAIQ
jgi:hypothetical protein